MGAIRKYFKEQFQWRMCYLEHTNHTDFCQLNFQSSRSAIPMLVWTSILFFGCFSTVVASFVLTITEDLMPIGYWIIYMTHWGLIVNTFTTLAAVCIAWRCYLGKTIESDFGLPWYLKLYWVLHNISISTALFITIFYWTLLSSTTTTTDDASSTEEQVVQTGYEFDNTVLDIFIHGMNSVLMFLLLLTTKVPTRLAHVYHLITFCVIYMSFTIIYYYSGGTDAFGNLWIYPVMDWSAPGPAVIMVFISLFMLFIIYGIVVAIAAARDLLINKYWFKSKSVDLEY